MLAAMLYGKERLRLEPVAVPQVGPDEILVKVQVALTCGTDLKVFRRGYHARMIRPPAVLGHELAGDIVSIGSEVTTFQLGQRVVAANSAPCGDCFHCHVAPLFTDNEFHNNGLDLDPPDEGLAALTGKRLDRGKFKTPTLRNVEYTAPYMHDGRFQTLEEVVEHYDSGFHRTILTDPLLLVRPNLDLDPADKRALVAFLKALSDPQLQAR